MPQMSPVQSISKGCLAGRPRNVGMEGLAADTAEPNEAGVHVAAGRPAEDLDDPGQTFLVQKVVRVEELNVLAV